MNFLYISKYNIIIIVSIGGKGERGGLIAVQSHSQLLPSQATATTTTGATAGYQKSLAVIKSKSKSTFADRRLMFNFKPELLDRRT